MKLFHTPSMTASAAAASILAAALLAAPGAQRAQHRGIANAAVLALGCHIEAAPGHAAWLRLTNTGASTLASGTRYVWATLGTPAAQGETGVLAQPLAPGESISLVPTRAAHGAGCTATAAG